MATIFPDKTAIVAELMRDRVLNSLGSYLNTAALDPDYLYAELLAAESEISHTLRVYLQPTVIVPDDTPQSELDAMDAADIVYATEAAYDYDPDFFSGESWGYIVTKQKPIISVQSIVFAYPVPQQQFFQIPAEWIRLDKKYGHIRLVPAAMAFAAPLSAFIMQALGGGRTIPFMIRIKYTAGIKDVFKEYPELVDTIKKMAVLKIIQASFPAQSGSISADGLSQSQSVDISKYEDMIDRALNGPKGSNGGLMTAIHGIRMSVLG